MLLGNGHIFKALGKALGKFIHPRAIAHSWGNTHQAIILLGHIAEPVTKDLLILGLSLGL